MRCRVGLSMCCQRSVLILGPSLGESSILLHKPEEFGSLVPMLKAVWWHAPLIPAMRRQIQEDFWGLVGCPVYLN